MSTSEDRYAAQAPKVRREPPEPNPEPIADVVPTASPLPTASDDCVGVETPDPSESDNSGPGGGGSDNSGRGGGGSGGGGLMPSRICG